MAIFDCALFKRRLAILRIGGRLLHDPAQAQVRKSAAAELKSSCANSAQ